MLGELSGVAKFFLVTGYTDMRKSIDGLMAIVRDTYELDPYSNSLFLFCGRRCDRIKALHFEKAKSHPPCREEGFLSFVQKGENSPCFCGRGKTPPAAYPHENGTGRISGG